MVTLLFLIRVFSPRNTSNILRLFCFHKFFSYLSFLFSAFSAFLVLFFFVFHEHNCGIVVFYLGFDWKYVGVDDFFFYVYVWFTNVIANCKLLLDFFILCLNIKTVVKKLHRYLSILSLKVLILPNYIFKHHSWT